MKIKLTKIIIQISLLMASSFYLGLAVQSRLNIPFEITQFLSLPLLISLLIYLGREQKDKDEQLYD